MKYKKNGQWSIKENEYVINEQRGKTSDWSIFAGKPPLINQWQGYKTWENDLSLSRFAVVRKNVSKPMPGFEQN